MTIYDAKKIVDKNLAKNLQVSFGYEVKDGFVFMYKSTEKKYQGKAKSLDDPFVKVGKDKKLYAYAPMLHMKELNEGIKHKVTF